MVDMVHFFDLNSALYFPKAATDPDYPVFKSLTLTAECSAEVELLPPVCLLDVIREGGISKS